MSQRVRIALLFGGQSAEHEVSLMSAKNVAAAINPDKYELVLIGIDKSGKWFFNKDSERLINKSALAIRDLKINQMGPEVYPLPEDHKTALMSVDQNQNLGTIDLVFPLLHGPRGEDGTIQGLLKLANIPFVGSDVLGSAIGMDKDVSKRLLKEAQIPVAPFLVFHSHQKSPSYKEIVNQLGSPFFIKPANMGSSVGVNKITHEDQYLKSIKQAFQYDKKILFETMIKGREIECAVLGNETPRASLPGEILPQHEFYSYEAKYLDENGAILECPAKLSDSLVKKIQELSIKTFQTLCCEGMARVDFFLTPKDELIVNEVNTIPGFTKISMFPKMWEVSGLAYGTLIEELIQLALEKYKKDQQLSLNYLPEK